MTETEQVVGLLTVKVVVEALYVQPVPETEYVFAPDPDPADDSKVTLELAAFESVFVIVNAVCEAAVKVNLSAALVVGAKESSSPVAFVAVTTQSPICDVVNVPSRTKHPEPVTENEIPPLPEPPEVAIAKLLSAVAVLTVLVIFKGTWAPRNLKDLESEVALIKLPEAAFVAVTAQVVALPAVVVRVKTVDFEVIKQREFDEVSAYETAPVPLPPETPSVIFDPIIAALVTSLEMLNVSCGLKTFPVSVY